MTQHARYQDDVGAYLLGALDPEELEGFESHLARCAHCREEVERLRPAAEVLPATVEPVEPPARLKTALMAEVDREARAAGGAEGAREHARRGRPRRLPRLSALRPAFVAAALLVGLAAGFGVAQLAGDDSRTVVATVDAQMPAAGGTLEVDGSTASLTLHDMPELGATRVYQAWVQRGDRMVPARTFRIGDDGIGQVELEDVSEADGVYVTRELRGGAEVPSEEPIVSVPL